MTMTDVYVTEMSNNKRVNNFLIKSSHGRSSVVYIYI